MTPDLTGDPPTLIQFASLALHMLLWSITAGTIWATLRAVTE